MRLTSPDGARITLGGIGRTAAGCIARAAPIAAAVAAGLACKRVYDTNVPPTLFLLLAVLAVSARSGLAWSLTAGLAAAAALDFFFLEPIFAFGIDRAQDIAVFVVFCIAAAAVSNVAGFARTRARAAERRTAFVVNLLELCRRLAAALTEAEAIDAVLGEVGRALAAEARLEPPAEPAPLAGRAGRGRRPAELSFPLDGRPEVVRAVRAGPAFSHADRELGAAMAGLLDLALARLRLGRQLEETRLAAARHALGSTLLDAIAHDLRSPLAGIAAAAATLRTDAGLLGPDSALWVGVIEAESDRLNRLVANLVSMIRLDGGALQGRRQTADLVDAVNAAADRCGRLLRGRELRTRIPSGLPFVLVDPGVFEQVMFNVIDNASKFSPPGSAIELEARRAEDGAAEILVSDRGRGMPPDMLERAFEKFAGLAPPRAAGAGLGLGLSICRGLLEATGGSIFARNRPGGGLTVTVRLPAAPGPDGAVLAPAFEESA